MGTNYFTMNAYDTDVRIPEFIGLDQSGGGYSRNPCTADKAVNAFTRDGVIMPMQKCEKLPATLNNPIQTLAILHRRWYGEDDQHDVLIAASDGQLYWSYPGAETWHKMSLPAGWTGTRYASDVWSYVTYEKNIEGAPTIDVLLMSNSIDGMICVRGDNMSVEIVPTPYKFGVIARSNERIWGTAVPDEPDMLVYSAPMDPFDWEHNADQPEMGSDAIYQPSWDGDSFEALTQFGSQLIAFKRNRVWRIIGTDPGEYEFREQYGGGTSYPHTLAVATNYIYVLGPDGLRAYDGERVYPYQHETTAYVWNRLNKDALEETYGCIYKNKVYLALPLDGSSVNNAVLIFDTDERTFLLRENLTVEAFLPSENALYYTSSTHPGEVWQWKDDVWEEKGQAEPMHWETSWIDFNYKMKTKGGFTLYVTVECEEPVEVSFSIETEKKVKRKTVLFQPPMNGKKERQKRIQFGGTGRRFRLHIDSEGTTPWRIAGGIIMVVETDDD